GYHAAAQHSVEFIDPGRAMAGAVRLDGADRNRSRGRGERGASAVSDSAQHRRFVDRAPGATLQAASHPFGGDMAAFRTAVLRTRLGHLVTVSGWSDRSGEVRPVPAVRSAVGP